MENKGIIIRSERFQANSEAALTAQRVNEDSTQRVRRLSTDPTVMRAAKRLFRETDNVFVDTKIQTGRRGSRRLPGYGT